MPTHISLRFKHPYKDLSNFGSLLGLLPSKNWVAGNDRVTSNGLKLSGKYENSYCVLKIPNKFENINSATNFIDESINVSLRIKNELQDTLLAISLYCTLDNSGEAITIETMQILTKYGICLEID